MTNRLRNLKFLMDEIIGGKTSTKDLQGKIQDIDTLNDLIELEKLGFIERIDSEGQRHLSQTFWRVTERGNFFLRVFEPLVGEDFSIVMTIPPKFSNDITKKFDYVKYTDKIFKDMVSGAVSDIRIFSPYIDATFISILEKINPQVFIKIVTVPVKYSQGNPLLERLKTQKNINVKYLNEIENGVQIFQLHAKIFLVDNKKLYIGSANLRETSLFYNLESGILIQNKDIIEKYGKVFDYFFEMAR